MTRVYDIRFKYPRESFATVLYKTAQQVGKATIAVEVRQEEGTEDGG